MNKYFEREKTNMHPFVLKGEYFLGAHIDDQHSRVSL